MDILRKWVVELLVLSVLKDGIIKFIMMYINNDDFFGKLWFYLKI